MKLSTVAVTVIAFSRIVVHAFSPSSAGQSIIRATSTSLQGALSDNNHEFTTISRREALLGSFSVALATTPLPTNAAVVVGGATASAKVEAWPGIENLEPLYEFKLSVDALTAAVEDPKNWPYVKKRLDKFFKGSIFSETNFYMGGGLQYMNDMKYAQGELPNYIVMDKEGRYDTLDQTMMSLEGLKTALASGDDAGAIEDYAKDSQAALASWFALVPENNRKAVEELFVHVKKADLNRDGRLTDDGLAILSIPEQELWKRRVDKFG